MDHLLDQCLTGSESPLSSSSPSDSSEDELSFILKGEDALSATQRTVARLLSQVTAECQPLLDAAVTPVTSSDSEDSLTELLGTKQKPLPVADTAVTAAAVIPVTVPAAAAAAAAEVTATAVTVPAATAESASDVHEDGGGDRIRCKSFELPDINEEDFVSQEPLTQQRITSQPQPNNLLCQLVHGQEVIEKQCPLKYQPIDDSSDEESDDNGQENRQQGQQQHQLYQKYQQQHQSAPAISAAAAAAAYARVPVSGLLRTMPIRKPLHPHLYDPQVQNEIEVMAQQRKRQRKVDAQDQMRKRRIMFRKYEYEPPEPEYMDMDGDNNAADELEVDSDDDDDDHKLVAGPAAAAAGPSAASAAQGSGNVMHCITAA
jgi:hypothetical protein